MTPQIRDVVVLERDIPAHGLRRRDLGAVVDILATHAIAVEFAAASGRTQALVMLNAAAVRGVSDADLL